MNRKILIQSLLYLLINTVVIYASHYNFTQYNSDKPLSKKKISVIIVGHGAPAKDFPKLSEYFKLHDTHSIEAELLEEELRNWPRNANNDPYWAGFIEVINEFKKQNKEFYSVYYAFNEMCGPTVEEALEHAAHDNPEIIIVTSIMFTPGGNHSEIDIPEKIELFKENHPNIKIIYAWPYKTTDIVNMLSKQIYSFIEKN
ncbi:MAG: CbiX/SirB N-terminal domain-containing protein [Melioribacter sp.]|uniref:sirohydrochlorin chelatase n=1 Tax=Rosettibacter primus TaxID=3111523 RepID=UPI00247D9225|nr:CbiX/SirB N-terminal domain-containing protein [Melioribacter sp.]